MIILLNALYSYSCLGLCVNKQECIMGMLALKTVVYVTHKMESLPIADHIVVTLSLICIICRCRMFGCNI